VPEYVYPWIVYVMAIIDFKKQLNQYCAGTIISNKYTFKNNIIGKLMMQKTIKQHSYKISIKERHVNLSLVQSVTVKYNFRFQ